MMPRRQPPYAKILRARLADSTSWWKWSGTSAVGTVTIWVACGPDCWNWARKRIGTFLVTLCPPNEPPERFDWSLLAGHDPILVERCGKVSDDFAHRLCAALINDGVTRILDLETGNLHTVQEVAA